jgi:hypothetical protein
MMIQVLSSFMPALVVSFVPIILLHLGTIDFFNVEL